ncbi:MAG: TonB-dependent receptor [Rhodothermia bacterium]|nr:TonB-dependent receptor [Rhodothermia bacterium]
MLLPEVYSQPASVRGFVFEAESRRPLQGATIVLRSAGEIRRGTVTDGDGYFILPRVGPGSYDLTASFVGFATYRDLVTLGAGEVLERNIYLPESPGSLDEVVIEEQLDTGFADVKAGLQSVAPTDVQRVPVPGAGTDLAGYLQTLPGVVSQGDRGGQLFVRGGSSDQNLALLDGVPIYQPFHIVSFFSAFPEDIIDHADIYTAGFGAAYGTRLSSVMDVTARNGSKQRFRGSVSVAPFLSGARIEGPLIPDRVSVVLSARQSLVEEVTPNFLGQKLPYRFGDRFGKIHAFLGPRQSVSISFLDTDDKGDIAGTLKTFDGEFAPDLPDDDPEVRWSNRAVAARYSMLPRGAPLLIELGGGHSRSENEIGASDNPERQATIESLEGYLKVTVFAGTTELRAGGQWRKTDVEFALGGQFQNLDSSAEDETESRVFLETVHGRAAGALRINPGLALYNTAGRPIRLEPRLRLTASPSLPYGAHTINAAVGLYHQSVVGLNDERDVGSIFTVWVPAADSLDLPSAIHAVAGWTGRFPNGFGAAAEVFVKEFRELSVPEFSAFPSFTTTLQSADGTALGADLRLDIRGRPFVAGSTFDGFVSYTFTDVQYRTATLSYNPSQHRKHQLNVVAHTERNGVGFTIQWQYGSGFPFTESAGFDEFQVLGPTTDVTKEPGITRVLYDTPFRGRQPAYERIDVWLDKEVSLERARVTIRAGIINLFNRDNLFYFDLFTLRRVDQMPFIPSVGIKVEVL